MFLLPLAIFPFVFAAATYRLYTLPRRYTHGTLLLAEPGFSFRAIRAAIGYLALLLYTGYLAVLSVSLLTSSQHTVSAWLSNSLAFAGYPFSYVAAEWTFFYGFARRPTSAARSAPTRTPLPPQ